MAEDLVPRVKKLLTAEENAKNSLLDALVEQILALLKSSANRPRGKEDYERIVKMAAAAARSQKNTTKKWAELTLRELDVTVDPVPVADPNIKTIRVEWYTAWRGALANPETAENTARLAADEMLSREETRARATVFEANDDKIHAYRRVVHPEMSKGGACGLCVVASTRVYWVADLKPIHNGCHCGVVPITSKDPGGFINYDDLGDVYAANGGSTDGHALKRLRYTASGQLAESPRTAKPKALPAKGG